jgi:hypothetical protein
VNASAPMWVPLAMAAVGVVGVIFAFVFTQVWSRRREDERWRLERAAVQERWEQERQLRSERWLREDKARWLKDRRQAYAALLRAEDAWSSRLTELRRSRAAGGGATGPDTIAHIQRLETEYTDQLNLIQLMAPVAIGKAAEDIWAELYVVQLKLLAGESAIAPPAGALSDLTHAMRRDLGVE